MASSVPPFLCCRCLPASLLLFLLGLALGCDSPTAVQEAKPREPRSTTANKGSSIKPIRPDGPPPLVTASISPRQAELEGPAANI